ncbi:MAG: sulfatase-like hydrolase/transferase, partial [Bacteroidota bacterium]
ALLLATLAASPRAQPNIVLVTVDDLNTAVGFLSEEPGTPLQTLYPEAADRARIRAVLTPNLDRLAAEGVPFANATAASPICAPSRAALMTSVRPHTSNYNNNGDGHFRDTPGLASVQTLPEYLRANGYYTAGVGKVFHEWAVRLGTDGEITLDGPDTQRSWDTWLNRSVGTRGQVTWGPWSTEISTLRMGTTATLLDALPDIENADLIASVLQAGSATARDLAYDEDRTLTLPADRPFFLALGLYRPHTPLVVPEDLLALFPPDGLALTDSLRQVYQDDVADFSPGGTEAVRGAAVGSPTYAFYEAARQIDPENGPVRAWRDLVRHYLAAVALADRAIGRVMDALAASPHAATTVLVVVGDHGLHLGEKTWFGKATLWEEGTATPMVVWAPGLAGVHAPGVLRRQPVSLVDVYPTLVRLAGLPLPDHVEGDDLASLLSDPEADPVSTALVSFGRRDHALQTATHRYVRFANNRGNAELYDTLSDPEERRNLVPLGTHDPTRQQLDYALDLALGRVTPIDTTVPPMPGLALRLVGPNPSREAIHLEVTLPASAEVRWDVVDGLGRVVWREALGEQPPGPVALRWPGAGASGVYTARVWVGGRRVSTRRVALVR